MDKVCTFCNDIDDEDEDMPSLTLPATAYKGNSLSQQQQRETSTSASASALNCFMILQERTKKQTTLDRFLVKKFTDVKIS